MVVDIPSLFTCLGNLIIFCSQKVRKKEKIYIYWGNDFLIFGCTMKNRKENQIYSKLIRNLGTLKLFNLYIKSTKMGEISLS